MVVRLALAASLIVLLLAPLGSAQSFDRELEFECAQPLDGSDGSFNIGLTVLYGCPIRVYDGGVGGAGFPFGNIQLDVLDEDPDKAAFFTLHGSPRDDGATDNSRSGMTHTIFSTLSNGINWVDSWTPTGYPDGWYGESATGAMNDVGDLYWAFSWSKGSQNASYKARIWEGPNIEDQWDIMGTYRDEGRYVELGTHNDGNVLSMPSMVYVQRPEPEPVPATENETAEEPGELGERAQNVTTNDLIVMSWHESTVDLSATPNGQSAWIDFAWVPTGDAEHDAWMRLESEDLIGPCKHASNAVAWDGHVYVACTIDKGYNEKRGARVGDVHIWRFHSGTNRTEFVGDTGITGLNPRLAINNDGYFWVTTTTVKAEQEVEILASSGWYGRHMGSTGQDLGPVLHNAMGNHPLRDAHVTALEVMDTQNTAFLVYKEWNDVEPSLDPNNPLGGVRLNDYRKVIVSLDPCQAPIAGAEFTLGTFTDGYQKQAYDANPGGFNDVQDGLDVVRLPTGEERVYFAINDYGVAQYGSVVGASGLATQVCPMLPPPPVIIPAPAAPAALTLQSGVTNAIGATLGVGATAMVGYLLMARRKHALAASVEA